MTSHSLFRCTLFPARCHLYATILLCALWTCEARAQLVSLPPFSGSIVETFDTFPPGASNSPVVIMGGAATIQTAANGVAINSLAGLKFSLGSSSENAAGQCAVPADGLQFLGIEHDFSPSATIDVTFTNTVRAFGGFWGAGTPDSNSPTYISFTFFDAGDQQIGAPQVVPYLRISGDGMLEWHGWFSATPFKHVRVASTNIFTLVGDSFRAGTSSNFSVFTAIVPLTTTLFLLQGSGTTGVVYNVQASVDVTQTNWFTVGTVQPNASGNFLFTNASAFPQRFYRLQSP